MEITKLNEIRKGCVVAKFNFKLPKWDMEIRNCTWFNKSGKQWVSMPTETYEKDGKKNYYPVVCFGQDSQKRLQDALLIELNKMVSAIDSHEQNDHSDNGQLPF